MSFEGCLNEERDGTLRSDKGNDRQGQLIDVPVFGSAMTCQMIEANEQVCKD